MFKSGKKLHWIKNLWLRWRYGAGCCDTYCLYPYLAKRLSKIMRAFRDDSEGVGDEEFRRALDEMIFGFDYYAGNIACSDDDEEAFANRADAGIGQFGKKFRRLWW